MTVNELYPSLPSYLLNDNYVSVSVLGSKYKPHTLKLYILKYGFLI